MTAPKKARLTLAGTALFALVLGGILFAVQEVQTVHFVNALDLPVVVTVDGGGTLHVPSGGRASKRLVSGLHHVEVKTADGKPLEQGEVYVKSSSDRAVAWNVLGAAPLYIQSHVYTRHASAGRKPQVSTYAGARWVDREDVDYIFSSPPSSISTKDKSGRAIVRLQLTVAPGGWRTSLTLLENDGSYAPLAKLGEALLQVDPKQEEAFEAALKGWHLSEGPEAALAFLRRTMEAHPDLLSAHEKYQLLLQSLGQRKHVRAFYEGLLKESPESAVVTGYLLSRVEPPAEALARLETLVEQEPTRKRIRTERARLRFVTGRFEDAVADYDVLLDPRKGAGAEEVSAYLRSLVARGQAPAALKLAAQFGEVGGTMDWRLAVLYGRLMELVPKEEWPKELKYFVERAGRGRSDSMLPLWIAGRLGHEMGEVELISSMSEDMRKALIIQSAAWREPEVAWRECRTASVTALEMLDVTTTLLLAAEFERVGDTVLAGKLFDTLALHLPLSRGELLAAVFGPEGQQVLAHLDPEQRAAVLLARARRLDAQGLDSRALYAAVARDDLLKGVVTSAMRQWSRPARGSLATRREGVFQLVGSQAVSNASPP